MRLKSIVCFFIGVIEKTQRGWNSFHGHIRRIEIIDYNTEEGVKRSPQCGDA
jgi:hypothetical protein